MQGSRLIPHTQYHNNHIVSLRTLKSNEMFKRNNQIWFMSGLALTIRVTRDELRPLYSVHGSVHTSPSLYWVSTCLTKRVLCPVFKLRHFSISFQWKRIERFKCKSLTLFRSVASRKYECWKRCWRLYLRYSCFQSMIKQVKSKKLWTLFGRPNFCIWRLKKFV